MNEPQSIEQKAVELRQAFDRAFALPPPEASRDVEDLLAIRVAGDPYAVLLREVAGMVAGRKVVPVPASGLGLLGLAGIRGGIVPVFGLSTIMGYVQAADSPRWMILCGSEEPIALAFSDFEGHLRLPRSRLSAEEGTGATRQHVAQLASTDTGVRAVISIPLVLAAIRKGTGRDRLAKEK